MRRNITPLLEKMNQNDRFGSCPLHDNLNNNQYGKTIRLLKNIKKESLISQEETTFTSRLEL